MDATNMKNRAHAVGLLFAVVHTLLFVFTLLIIANSSDPQISLLWVPFAIADLPVIPLYLVNAFMARHGLSFNIYLPYVAHGFFGAIWWYLLPRLFMPKRLGGIWGKGESKEQGSKLSKRE